MGKSISAAIGITGLIVLVILLVIVGPFLTIWALNTLFPTLAIAYTWKTWCAVILLDMYFRSSSRSKNGTTVTNNS